MVAEQIGIIACSGASNTGSYSDLVARKLMQSGKAKMLCLARFSVDKKFAEKTKDEVKNIIVLDGCPINCAELTMKQNRIDNFVHINITDFGIVKGKTPVIEEKVNEIVNYILNLK
jgi:uncharacterized metal-binding protein